MPIIAAPTVWMSTSSGLMMPLPMVAATAVPAKVPARLSTAAISTAWCGRMTRVETTVAIALGASVQPFTNSAARISSSQGASGTRWEKSSILDDHVAHHVCVVLALVAGVLELVVDLL